MGEKKPVPTLEAMFDELVKQTREDPEADGYQVLAAVACRSLQNLEVAMTKQTAALLALTKVFEEQVNELVAALDDLRLGPPEDGEETPPPTG